MAAEHGSTPRQRGQAALEFMAMAALGSFVLAAAAVVAFGYQSYVETEKRASGGSDLCLLLGREANVAAVMGEGYERSFFLPASAAQFDYNVTFDNPARRVEVYWDGGSCVHPLSANVSGVLAQGLNRLRVANGVVMLN